MVKSGIVIDPDVKAQWTALSKRQISGFRFTTNEKRNKFIVVEDSQLAKKHKTPFESMCEQLPDGVCCFAGVDFAYKDIEGKVISKCILIMWSPDNGKIKDKMCFSSSQGAIKSELNVTEGNVIEMHGAEDKNIDKVLSRICSGKSAPSECEGREVVYDENEGSFKYA